MSFAHETDRRSILRGSIALAGAAIVTATRNSPARAQRMASVEEVGGIRVIGRAPAIASTHLVALYDPKDGRIFHTHRLIRAAGAQQLRTEDIEGSARAHAQEFGLPVDTLRALHLPGFQDRSRRFRVDVNKQVLVELPFKPLPRSPRKP